jgi:hypothetical protein
MKKISLFFGVGILSAILTGSITLVARAETTPQAIANTIDTTFKNVVDTSKTNAAKNGGMRNELVVNHSFDLQTKEKNLADQLSVNLSSLENIQSRIAAKTDEVAADGTDVDTVTVWLASSTIDMDTAQNNLSIFASSTLSTSTAPVGIVEARKLADNAIDAVNATHDDLQSALAVLTEILQ